MFVLLIEPLIYSREQRPMALMPSLSLWLIPKRFQSTRIFHYSLLAVCVLIASWPNLSTRLKLEVSPVYTRICNGLLPSDDILSTVCVNASISNRRSSLFCNVNKWLAWNILSEFYKSTASKIYSGVICVQ